MIKVRFYPTSSWSHLGRSHSPRIVRRGYLVEIDVAKVRIDLLIKEID